MISIGIRLPWSASVLVMSTSPFDSGRQVEFSCLTISRCRDGRIEEEWELGDTMTLLRQIGVLPQLAEA